MFQNLSMLMVSVEFETTFRNNVKEGVEKHYSPSGRVETEVLFKK